MFNAWVVVTQPAKIVTWHATRKVKRGKREYEEDASFQYEAMGVRDATAAEIAEAKRG